MFELVVVFITSLTEAWSYGIEDFCSNFKFLGVVVSQILRRCEHEQPVVRDERGYPQREL